MGQRVRRHLLQRRRCDQIKIRLHRWAKILRRYDNGRGWHDYVHRRAARNAIDNNDDAGERLARSGEQRAAEAAAIARDRIADASERLADTIRPKPKRHRIRKLLIAVAVLGGVAALVQSPLRAKLTERIFGPPPEEEPDSIELPGSEPVSESQSDFSSPAEPASQAEGNGVPSAPSSVETGQG